MSLMTGCGTSGGNYDFNARNADGEVWNGTAFIAWDADDYLDHRIAATEDFGSGEFYATAPAGTVSYVMRKRGASLALSKIVWRGSMSVRVSPDGLDDIPVADPGGVASTFPEMVVQTWRRFFKRATRSSTQILTYADDGTTVRTTQTVSAAGNDEVQGPAS